MIKPILVGLTGGIGSGKSTVAKIFEILGAPVYYADNRARWLLQNDLKVKDQVIALFSNNCYNQDGLLNRTLLAERVFSNNAELEKLNQVIHPAVADDFRQWVNDNARYKFLLKEAALLFENGSYIKLDYNICVMAPKQLRIQRVILRDSHRSEEQIQQIINKQVSDGKRRKLSNFLIDNSGKDSIIEQVISVYKAIL